MASAAPKQQLRALSEQLSTPMKDPGTFENIPRIKRITVRGHSSDCNRFVYNILTTICRTQKPRGANSPLGIGRATAHQFAHNGAKAIFICDFKDQYLPVHKRELNSLYPNVEIHPRQFDAADEESVKKVVQEALDKYGRLDVMFANAGVSLTQTRFTESSTEDFMKVRKRSSQAPLSRVPVNPSTPPQPKPKPADIPALFPSVFLAAKHAAKAMQQTHPSTKPYPSGSIIGTASVAGLRSNAGATDYSASKAAVISLMQTCAYQLAGTGIRCNAICPGIIETGMTSAVYEMARARGTERKIGQLNPLMRGGLADEVARVVLFLAGDESGYVNGQALPVCGGLSAGHPFVPGKLA
ncbi:MAG: hypothetical protein Q9157_001550 [Trypethelium eluteriae]